MRIYSILFWFIFFVPQLSLSQSNDMLELDTTIRLPFLVDHISNDQSGNIFVVSNRGVVVKYNVKGDSLLSYSPKKNSNINLIEAGNGLKTFLFYKDFQQYVFLDQYLTASSFFSFYPDKIGYAELATISSDNNIWVVDATNFSIKKYNIEANILEVVSPLGIILDPDEYSIDYMREYQNLLFLYDKNKGIFLFDNFGSLQRKFVLPGLDFLNFYGDHIYYIKDGFLTFMNIYNGALYGIPLPHYESFNFALRFSSKIFLFTKEEMSIYNIISN